jgi:hypothetical protein
LRVWDVEKPVRALREMTGSTLGGSEGGVMLVDLGDSDIEGVSSSSSEIMVKIFPFFFNIFFTELYSGLKNTTERKCPNA